MRPSRARARRCSHVAWPGGRSCNVSKAQWRAKGHRWARGGGQLARPSEVQVAPAAAPSLRDAVSHLDSAAHKGSPEPSEQREAATLAGAGER